MTKIVSEQPKYTTILHKVRLKLELSCNEYCVADMIYHLSTNPSAKVVGWCYASKEHIADFLGLEKSNVHRIINRLLEKGLLEKDLETKWLRTTEIWYENVIIGKVKSDSGETPHIEAKRHLRQKRNATLSSGETPHYNNIYKYKDNNIIAEATKSPNEINELFTFFKENINPHINFANKTERKSADTLLKTYGLVKIKQALQFVESKRVDDPYLPSITTPYELLSKWAKLKQHFERNSKKVSKHAIYND